MEENIFPWQAEAWRQLQAMRDRLPHAILFHGSEGIGKTAFAEQFAKSLLCEQPAADGHACGRCGSCGWFAQYSHPDYRRLRPEVLEEDADTEAEQSASRAKTKTPSKDIKIDQVRGLADFMNISTHRSGRRVVLLHPAEALNAASANALLKTLEEPPPQTVFLLVSHGLDRLLPTILSRCRKFALPMPDHEQALAWLAAQGIKDAKHWLAEQGGAPLTAHAMAQVDARDTMDEFLGALASPGIDASLRAADRLQKAAVPELVAWLQRWLYDLFSFKLTGRIRYYPRYGKELAALAGQADTGGLLRVLKAANERRAVAEHPLSAKLFIEDMLLDYSSLFAKRRS
jgi:DNA polymerase-3 subunit delta'